MIMIIHIGMNMLNSFVELFLFLIYYRSKGKKAPHSQGALSTDVAGSANHSYAMRLQPPVDTTF